MFNRMICMVLITSFGKARIADVVRNSVNKTIIQYNSIIKSLHVYTYHCLFMRLKNNVDTIQAHCEFHGSTGTCVSKL